MKIAHISDTHVGKVKYGLIETARDFYEAFIESFERAIDHKPDVIVHTGDVLDTFRVSTSTLKVIVEKLMDYSNCCPIVITPGNHDFPVSSGYSPFFYFMLFKHSNIFINEFADVNREMKVEPIIIQDVAFFNIPYIYDRELLSNIMENINIRNDKLNILLMHQIIDEIPAKFKNMGIDIPHESLKAFDFKLVGHYHVPYMNEENKFCYAGSTEALSYDEYIYDEDGFPNENTLKRIWIYELNEKSLKFQYEILKSPRMHIYKRMDVDSLESLEAELKNLIYDGEKKPILVLELNYDGDVLEVMKLTRKFEEKHFLKIILKISERQSQNSDETFEDRDDFGPYSEIFEKLISIISQEDRDYKEKARTELENFLKGV